MTGVSGKIRIVLRILLGLMFFGAGAAKLLGAQAMVDEFGLFAQVGIGQWFRYVTGLIEISAAIMLIRATTAYYGGLLIACVCAGAFVAQVAIIHQDWIHTIVIGAIAVWTAWGYRGVAVNPATTASAA